MPFVVLAPAVGHPGQLLPPLVQRLGILGIQLRGPFGVHIFQIALPSHAHETNHPEEKFWPGARDGQNPT